MVKPEASLVVRSLSSAINSGDHSLGNVPGLLKRVLIEGLWQEFVTPRGELVEYDRFIDFVTTPPSRGLGATVDLIRRLIADDTEAVDLLDRALQNEPSKHAVDNVNSRPDGNSQDAALRRLRKDAPALHAEVLAGSLSAHAAMVKAGYRPKTFTVRADDPQKIAATLRRHLEPAAIDEIVAQLKASQA